MAKLSALTAVILAFLSLPALASAAPTSTQITSPAAPLFLVLEAEHPAATTHIAGTTTGGAGNVDLRCYAGADSTLVASQVPVGAGAFSIDLPLLQLGTGGPPCLLRAVPTGTVPNAPQNQPSPWEGQLIGTGQHGAIPLGPKVPDIPADAIVDYYSSQTQSRAFNDYYSIADCGLCSTALVVPGTGVLSNTIWFGNAAAYYHPAKIPTRASVQVDGLNAFSGRSAVIASPGLPAITVARTTDPATGDLEITEEGPFASCAEDPAIFPITASSCATYANTGVGYERVIRQTDDGQLVTIVDHWKSEDAKQHDLDVIYEDTARAENGTTAGHEGRLNFTWTQDGFKKYVDDSVIPVPANVPSSLVVKTDASTPSGGDNLNPFGAMTFGSRPTDLLVRHVGDAADKTGTWQSHYRRTIPAGGEITIAVAYSHDFALASVQLKSQAAEKALAAPALHIDAPADGAATDSSSVHVSGTASSADGQVAVTVNGVNASIDNAGNWSADLPLGDGANRLLVSARNKLGVVTNAAITVTRHAPNAATEPAAPSDAQTAPAGAAPAAAPAAKPIRCVVPNLRGKTLARAKTLLNQAHCRLGTVARQASKRVKAGHVLQTRLKAGTRHPAGTRIRVTVARAA